MPGLMSLEVAHGNFAGLALPYLFVAGHLPRIVGNRFSTKVVAGHSFATKNAVLTDMTEPTGRAGGSSVLEDPTGRRARWLRRAGRVVFVVFLGWLLAIVLGGLGLIPAAGIPLGHVLRPSQGPPALAEAPDSSRTLCLGSQAGADGNSVRGEDCQGRWRPAW